MVEQQGAWHGPSRWSHGHNKTPNSYSISKHTELHDNHRRKVAVLEIEGCYKHFKEVYGSYTETFTFIFFLLLLFLRCPTFVPGGWWKGPKKCNNQDSLTLHGWNFCAITKVSNLFDLLRGGKSDSWKKIQDLVSSSVEAVMSGRSCVFPGESKSTLFGLPKVDAFRNH